MVEQAKRSHNSKTVRRRCNNYILALKERGYSNELPRDQAIELFCQIIDQWDRLTIKAYFGAVAHRSKRQFYQDSQYASGTISHKTITLSQQVKQSKGYLERLGLVSFNLKGNVWFMKIENAVLFPQLGIAHESVQKISISPVAQSNLLWNEREKTTDGTIDRLENKQQLEDERDKFHSRAIRELNLLESALLRAAPLPKGEPDKARIDCDGFK